MTTLNFRVLFLVLFLLFLLSVASTLDFKDEKIEHDYNCEMVELGHYPEQFCK